MMSAVFKKTLRDSRRSMMWLSIGLGLYALMMISFYPSILEQREQMQELIDSYPKAMMGLMGGGTDVENLDFTRPGTYVHVEFMNWAVLILGVMLIVQCFNHFTNAERDGSMDMMLSLPVSRRTYLLACIAKSVVLTLVVLTASYIGLFLGSLIWTEFDIQVIDLALGIYGAFFLLMVVVGFTYLLVAIVPSSQRFVGGVVYLLFVGSFLLYGLSTAVEGLDAIQPLMIFKYYNPGAIIEGDLEITHWIILSITALTFFGAAYWVVDRKELGV
jgi:ABC-2 type transport system permease protein